MIDQSRKAALDALNDITKNKSYGNLAVKTAFNSLNPQDKRFAARLVYGTVEKLITIDWIIDNYVKKRTPGTLKNVLRLGTYQIYFMDSVPERAACSTSVELAKSIGKSGASGFINGVLRNIARGKDELKFPEGDLSIKYSCPNWIVEMWTDELGREQAEKLLAYEDEKGIVIRPNSLKGCTPKKLEDELKKLGISFEKGSLLNYAYRVDASFEDIEKSLFEKGKIAIQDQGSMAVAEITVKDNPKTVLDACAAPGGKTAAMANLLPDADYFATDIHKHRVALMEKMFTRLNVDARTYRFDAADKPFELELDCVLVDAPCSGLGTMFKQPDIKYNKTYDDIKELKKTQIAILENCAKSVKTGGYLVYSTCTISKAENYDVVKKFLENNDHFEIVKPDDHTVYMDAFDGLGIQLMPHIHNTSGFYIAKMRKIK